MRMLALISLVALASCGADGDPVPRDTGVNVSGDARIGVTGTL
jgi:hypothetical protein